MEHAKIHATVSHQGIKRDADGWEHNAYHAWLNYEGRSMQTDYRAGMGITEHATAEDIVLAVFNNILADGASFEEWADDYGYDRDSRKAEAIYNACKKQGEDLQRMLGDAAWRELDADLTRRDVETVAKEWAGETF